MTEAAAAPRIAPVPGDGAIVTLALVKAYLKIEHDLEDAVLSELIIPAAEDYCIWYVRRPAEQCALLPAVKAAVCLSCGDLYLNREAMAVGAVFHGNPTVDALLWAHRDLCGVLGGGLEGEWCPDYAQPLRINPLVH